MSADFGTRAAQTPLAGWVAIGIIARAPAGKAGDAARDDGREMLTAALEEVTANDSTAARELESLVTEINRIRSLTIVGEVGADEVTDGTVTGAETTGKLDSGAIKVTGVVKIGKGERVEIVGTRIELRLLPTRQRPALFPHRFRVAPWSVILGGVSGGVIGSVARSPQSSGGGVAFGGPHAKSTIEAVLLAAILSGTAVSFSARRSDTQAFVTVEAPEEDF